MASQAPAAVAKRHDLLRPNLIDRSLIAPPIRLNFEAAAMAAPEALEPAQRVILTEELEHGALASHPSRFAPAAG